MPAEGATRSMRSAALRAPAWVAAAALLLVAVFAFYARTLGRGFTSEDFLLVRYLGEHPPWHDLHAQLAEPWLGMRGIEFFRPVSTLLYGLEIAAFGIDPRGYVLVHLLTHWLAAMLIFAIARELVRHDPQMTGAAAAPWIAALLFAIYPLHPNAVVFIASFATLFGGFFALLSLYAYQRFRAASGRGWWLAAFVAFILALSSYEATAVLPIWLAAHDQLVVEVGPPSRWRRLLATLPFFALLTVYFGWRQHLFGDFVGGYAATRERLGDAPTLTADLFTSLGRLHLPFFSQPISVAGAAAMLLAVLAAVAFLSRRRERAAASGWAFGWVMAISAMAPFAFRPVVPANGRYWYLAAAGAAIGVVFLAAGLSALLGSRRWLRVLPWSLAAVVGLAWASGLVRNVAAHRRAADAAESVRSALLDARPGDGTDALPLFVTGHPDFLTEPPGINVAPVLRYGLRDGVNPPFVDASAAVDVYPLPSLADRELVPIALASGRVLAWDAATSRLRAPAISAAHATLSELAINGPSIMLRVPAGHFHRFRLLLATPINGMVVEADATSVTNGVLRVPLPVDLLAISDHLYGSRDVYLWVEARDERGELAGSTRLHRLTAAAPGQARSLSPIM